eukprot:GEMP01027682.1.p1 GENE.GEMP01027682.1~~GEMP01027682.1.p1  ORF type:complete len:752 (+),score=114.83 GEMP01027682.1:12-2267(+)
MGNLSDDIQRVFDGTTQHERLAALESALEELANSPDTRNVFIKSTKGLGWLMSFGLSEDCEVVHSVANLLVAILRPNDIIDKWARELPLNLLNDCYRRASRLSELVLDFTLDEKLSKVMSALKHVCGLHDGTVEINPVLHELLNISETPIDLTITERAVKDQIERVFTAMQQVDLISQFRLLDRGVLSYFLFILVSAEVTTATLLLLVENLTHFVHPSSIVSNSRRYSLRDENYLVAYACKSGILQCLALILESAESRDSRIEQRISRALFEPWRMLPSLRPCMEQHVITCCRVLLYSCDRLTVLRAAELLRNVIANSSERKEEIATLLSSSDAGQDTTKSNLFASVDESVAAGFVPQVGLPIIVDLPPGGARDVFFTVSDLPAMVVWEVKLASTSHDIAISLAQTHGSTSDTHSDDGTDFPLLGHATWATFKVGDPIDKWECDAMGTVRLRFENKSRWIYHAKFEYRAYLLYEAPSSKGERTLSDVSTGGGLKIERTDEAIEEDASQQQHLLVWLRPHQIIHQSFVKRIPKSEPVVVEWSSTMVELQKALVEVGHVHEVSCVFRTAPLPDHSDLFIDTFKWELLDVFQQTTPPIATVMPDVKCVMLYFFREAWQQGLSATSLVCVTDPQAPVWWRLRTCCCVEDNLLRGTGFCDDSDIEATLNSCVASVKSIMACEHVVEYRCDTDEVHNLGVARGLEWPGMFKVMLGLPKLRNLADILSSKHQQQDVFSRAAKLSTSRQLTSSNSVLSY